MPPKRRSAWPPDLPRDEVLVNAWRRRLDPARTTIKQFVEYYRVPTKAVKLIGEVALKDYHEYPAQAANREVIERQWANGEGGKIADAKPRQDGHTTGFLTLFWERFVRGGGGTWNIFSYDDDAVREIFRTLLSFRKQTPDWVFAHLVNERRSAPDLYVPGGGHFRKGSATQIELAFPDGNASMLQCFTAGDKQSGSGSAPRGILWDEFSKWKAEVKEDPTAMSEGWADLPGNIWAIPSTGQGNERFAAIFMEALNGHGDSGLKAVFYAWLGHPDRHVPFKNAAARAAFAATVGKLKEYGIKQEQRLVAAGATLEELHWYRRKVSGPAIHFDLAKMFREYPIIPADMFQGSAQSVLFPEILASHSSAARDRERNGRVGEFLWRDGRVVFVEVSGGQWTLFEDVVPQSTYAFGCDPASAKVKVTGSSRETDFAVAYFGEILTHRTCARLRGHISGRHLAEELFKAAVYFNGARGYIERNQHGELVIEKFEGLTARVAPSADRSLSQFAPEVTRWYRGDDLLLLQQHPQLADGKKPEPTSGWLMSKKSKERVIDALREHVVSVGELPPGRADTPWCPIFIDEGLVFERDDAGNASATIGHDDCVIAKGLELLASAESLEHVVTSSPVRKKVSAELQFYLDLEKSETERAQDAELRKPWTSTPLGDGY